MSFIFGFFITLLIITCIIFYKRKKNCVFLLFSTIWIVFILLAIPLYNDYSWSYFGLIYIIITCFLFGMGENFGTKFVFSSNNKERTVNKIVAWKILFIFIILAFLCPISDLRANGFSLNVLFDFEKFLKVNNYFEYQRYNEEVSYSTFHQVLLAMMYLAPLCGGYLYTFAESKKNKFLAFFSLIPGLLSTLFTNAKTGITIAVFLWISGFLTSYLYRNKRFPRLNKKSISIIFLSVVALTFIFVISFFARAQKFDSESISFVLSNLRDYGFGHVQSFDRWFDIGEKNQYSFGFMTYLGISSKIYKSVEIESGVYSFMQGAATNVFTAFRGTIQDFGLIGSLLYFIILGLISGLSIKAIICNGSKVAQVLLASTILFIVYSFLISAWTFLVLIGVFILFYIFIFFVDKFEKNSCSFSYSYY